MAPLIRRRGSAAAVTVTVVVLVTEGNAPFLGACVASLTRQERRPRDVVLSVGGGGADTAALVAAAVEAAAEKGLSATVHTGAADRAVSSAGGSHVLVVEAGDVLVPAAISALAGALERTGSPVAVAGDASTRGADAATLVTAPSVLSSAEPATTMIESAFWRTTGLSISGEPALRWLPAVQALLAAGTFDVVSSPVRRGQRRGTGVPFAAMTGIHEHLPRVLPHLEGVLGQLADPRLRAAREHLVHRLLGEDVSDWLEEAESCDAESWAGLSSLVRELLRQLPPDVLLRVPVERRVRGWLAAQDRFEDLVSFNVVRWHEEGDYPVRVHGRGIFAELPVAEVPEELLELAPAESALVTQLRRARWLEEPTRPGARLQLELVAYTSHLGAEAGPASARWTLVNDTGVRIGLDAVQVRAADVDVMAGQSRADHRDALWHAVVDADRLLEAGPAGWSVEVDWERAGVRRSGTVVDLEHRGAAAGLPPRGRDGHVLAIEPHTARLVVRRSSASSGAPVGGPSTAAEVTGLAIDGDVLTVTGAATDGRHVLRLRGPRGLATVKVAATGGSFVARLPLRHDPWGLGDTPLPTGSYRLRDAAGPLVLAEELVGLTPYVLRSDELRVRVERNPDGSAQLALGPPLGEDEAGPRAQHELRRWYASDEHRVDPRTVFLQSYNGLSATDSPLAIHRELRRVRPDLRLVWSAADASTLLPEGAERALLRSREWYAELARAASIVTNIDMDEWFVKRPGQRLLQTFHGYPAKAMGVMAWEAKHFPPSLVARHLRRTSATWDLALTPHPDMDVHYREQYRYEGPILAAGYPRDDELVGPDAGGLREDTRRRLGIGRRTAVLYAPTWRDDLTTNFRAAALPSTLDVEGAAESLGDDFVLLMRGHRFHRQRPEVGGRLLDVTSYPEINHLILAADAAVLDYSSLRFDMALTRRPMIFLVPDLARYETDVRGFLYDFRSSAPGPLVDTTAQVVEALRNLDVVAEQYAPAADAFHERFNVLQDGHAAERVVAAFFGPTPAGE